MVIGYCYLERKNSKVYKFRWNKCSYFEIIEAATSSVLLKNNFLKISQN